MMKPEAEKPQTWAEVFNPDLYGQQAVRIASNACFATFVVTVLTFTVIAVTYQPPDPWLQSVRSLTILLRDHNVTYHRDESVIITAEDAPSPTTTATLLPGAINETFVEEEVISAQLNSTGDCDVNSDVNCSAPGVLFAIERHNLQRFSSLEFYSYMAPVKGSSDKECDVAWTYRSGKDGSPRLYRDFRRYTLSVLSTCEFQIEGVGDWHSGVNARPKRRRDDNQDVPTEMTSTSPDVKSAEAGADLPNDGIVEITEKSFLEGKYLYYERGGDYCKSMSHYMWSLLCGLGEARYLNRTFVMDLEVCLSSSDNPGHKDEKGKDFRFYYDYEHLRESLSIIDQKQFLKDFRLWESRRQKVGLRAVEYTTSSMELQAEQSTVLKRVFDQPEPNNYWFRVCEGDSEKAFSRPWDAIWKSRRIDGIVLAIGGKMGWDYDAVHVVRGAKVDNTALWPNLNKDTSPEAIVRKLDEKIMYGRNVYIATNEVDEHYFDHLRGKWKVFQLEDFKYLWAEDSEWYKETMELNGGVPVEFDGYMRVLVDTEVLYKAKARIETFNDLTNDCKNGVGAC
ncbi:unnamed protein product [Calypogeia fissa]